MAGLCLHNGNTSRKKRNSESVKQFAKLLVNKFELSQVKVNGKVSVRMGETEGKYLAFVFNYTDTEQNAEIEFMGKTISVTVTPNDSIILQF